MSFALTTRSMDKTNIGMLNPMTMKFNTAITTYNFQVMSSFSYLVEIRYIAAAKIK